jgi:hypothetical protein
VASVGDNGSERDKPRFALDRQTAAIVLNQLSTPARHVHYRPTAIPVFFATLIALLPGCAMVTNGLHQSVEIASVPAGATVLIDGEQAGQTPLTVSLPRAHTHRVELRKAAFVSVTQYLRSQPDDYLRRQVRFGLDLDSGAANELTPAAINVELKPEATTAPASGDAFDQMTAAVLAADDLWHRGAVSEAEHREMIEKILARFGR